jgi:hypothetical protein
LLLFPYLKEIVANGRMIKIEKERYERHNTDNWFLLETEIYLDSNKLLIRSNIRQDNNGKLYYDHYIVKDGVSSPTRSSYAGGQRNPLNDTIKQNSLNVKQNLELNLNIVKEEYLTRDDRIKIGNKLFSLKDKK